MLHALWNVIIDSVYLRYDIFYKYNGISIYIPLRSSGVVGFTIMIQLPVIISRVLVRLYSWAQIYAESDARHHPELYICKNVSTEKYIGVLVWCYTTVYYSTTLYWSVYSRMLFLGYQICVS